MLIQKKAEGIVGQIQSLTTDRLKLQAQLAEKELELKQSPLYTEVELLKREIATMDCEEQKLRDQGKDLMLQAGLKEMKCLNGDVIALHKTPGALKIEDGAVIPQEFYRVKKEIDKTSLKKAFNEGKITDERIYIESDYKLVITSK